jgi:hypothetical protein
MKTLSKCTKNGYKICLVIVDGATRKRYVALLKKKSEFMDKFDEYRMTLLAEGVHIRSLCADNDGIYRDSALKAYCQTHGIVQEFSPPYCPAANGVAEVSFRDLFTMARCILADQNREDHWWGVAVQFAADISNYLMTNAVADIPPEAAWKDQPISFSHFRVPLCDCFFYVEHKNRDDATLSMVREPGIFVGYSKDSSCYMVKQVSSGKVYARRYAEM